MVIDHIDYTIAVFQKEVVYSKKYGYPCTQSNTIVTDGLISIRDSLEREKLRRKYNKNCFDIKVSRYARTAIKNSDPAVQVDNSGEEDWIINNPHCSCIRREKWEECAVNYCRRMGITFTSTTIDDTCNLAFEISRDIIDPCVAVGVAISLKSANLGYLQKRDEGQCRIDYEIALEKGCQLEYEVYYCAVQSGLTYDLIKLIYDKGLEIIYEGGEVFLRSTIGKYNISGFYYDEAIGDQDFKDLVKMDPRKFVRKYLSDYNLTEDDITHILK